MEIVKVQLLLQPILNDRDSLNLLNFSIGIKRTASNHNRKQLSLQLCGDLEVTFAHHENFVKLIDCSAIFLFSELMNFLVNLSGQAVVY